MMEEPGALIQWTMYFYASGHSEILGTIGMVLYFADVLAFQGGHRLHARARDGVRYASVILFLSGSAALPMWKFGFILLWISDRIFAWYQNGQSRTGVIAAEGAGSQDVAARLEVRPSTKSYRAVLFNVSMLAWLLVGLAIESSYQIWWPIKTSVSRLMIIADSVTAGLIDGEDTWPRFFAETANVQVLDASEPGATLQSALDQYALFDQSPATMILEIGGNDMLEGRPVSKFTEDLEKLLSVVSRPGRTLIMFELPLPPFCEGYGIAQRQLAYNYHVHLIPKRYFTRILTTSGSTVDGIHLSRSGQKQMSQLIFSLLLPAIEPGVGTYKRLDR